MSLTGHLSNKESPVSTYLHEIAPRLALAGTRGNIGRAAADELGFDEVLGRTLVVAIPDTVPDRLAFAAIAGTAFDYRARMMIGPFRPTETTAAQGVLRLAADARSVPNGEHRRRVLTDTFTLAVRIIDTNDDDATHEDDDEARRSTNLDQAAALLAWCESVYRGFPDSLNGALGHQLDAASTGVDMLASVPATLLSDIARLRIANKRQLADWRGSIAAGTRFAPNPVFAGSALVGGADADWLIGATLIDCKTLSRLTRPALRKVLFQLLGYVLLDFDDRLRIRDVGIWLPRYAALASWRVEDLLGADAVAELPRLRAGMRAAVQARQQAR